MHENRENPIHEPDADIEKAKPKLSRTRLLVGGGGILVCAVLAIQAFTYYSTVQSGDASSNDVAVTFGMTTTASSSNSMYDENGMYDNSSLQESEKYEYGEGVTKEVEVMPAEIFEILVSHEDRIEYVHSVLDSKLPELEKEYNERLRNQGRPELGTIVPAAETNTGQQILDRMSLLDFATSNEENVDTRLKLMQSRVDSSSSTYSGIQELMQSGTVIESADRAVAETQVFYNSVFNKTDPAGEPTKVIELVNIFTADKSQAVFTLVASNSGGAKEWVIRDVKTRNDPNWKRDLTRIQVK